LLPPLDDFRLNYFSVDRERNKDCFAIKSTNSSATERDIGNFQLD
jgi:hypothetical protein